MRISETFQKGGQQLIVIVTTQENQLFYETLNSVERYNFHFTKSQRTNELCEEIDRLQVIDCFIIDYDAIEKEEINYFLEWATDIATTLVVASGLTSYDMVVQDFYSLGVINVLTDSGQDLAKSIVDFLTENIQPSSATKNSINIPPAPDTKTTTSFSPSEETIRQVPARSQIAEPLVYGRQRAYTIAFAGAGGRIGTTTQVFQTAYYLQSLLKTVAILDMQENSLITKLNGNHAGIKQIKNSQYLVYGIDYFFNPLLLASLKNNYDYVILDYGNFKEVPDITAFIEKDTHILVCGYKAWEEKDLQDSFSFDSGQTKYLFSFVSKQKEPFILNQMADLAPRTYFTIYTPDVEKYCGDDVLYQVLTGAKSFKEEAPTKEKKKSFLFGKRRAE